MERSTRYGWVFHVLVIVVMLAMPVIVAYDAGLNIERLGRKIFTSIFIIPLYLTNVFFLVPRYLKQRKYWEYAIGIVVMIAAFYYFFKWVDPISDISFVFHLDSGKHFEMPPARHRLPRPIIPFLLLTLTLGTSFEMLLDWERRGKVIEKTKKEKLSAELSFLKSQVNPHFLFNTLNSIYAMAATDSYNTQRAVLLLSNLMRYILYESNVEKVSLTKEIQFLNDFIDLHKLRYSKTNSKEVEFNYDSDAMHFDIEPLLLVPFVENAFKHSHSYTRKTRINVSIQQEHREELVFKVSNSVGDFSDQMEKDSGIGLENVKRRLHLLYPDRHKLEMDRSNDMFNVTLKLSK
ncbi:hypothetical protein FNH22_11350 [Fulvivirga sp. M361]|uniref:sensor histidine kinase n=1 Tax=Fulvivirga sp. M361 TaxID=2594266 RepID=UPI0011799B48|nr:histidine kinase [Fulvivirga sp. M361]TRX59112.1 hypothetical protein FNH22_11350 [Fulvivirga sp. M361]